MNQNVNDPVQDLDRLLEIAAYDLYSDDVRSLLDDIARRGAELFGLPLAAVTIVLEGAQYFAGSHGLGGWLRETAGTPIEWSFCANAVRRRDSYIVTDAATDELQHDNPLVTEDGIRCYAGAPLVAPNGQILGAFCVIGTDQREFSESERQALRDLAAEVMSELERFRI